MVKSWVNLRTWLLIGSCAANQEPACLFTQLLTMTTTHKFPSLAGDVSVQVGAGHGAQRQVVVRHQLLGVGVLLLDVLLAQDPKVFVPDHAGRRLAAKDPTRQVDVVALQVGARKDVAHRAGVVKDLGPARPHDHLQLDPLGAGLRRGKVNPAPVQAAVRLADVADLERGGRELKRKFMSFNHCQELG